MILGIRPEHLVSCEPEDCWVSGTLDLIENLGEYLLVHLNTHTGVPFIIKMDRNTAKNLGDTIFVKPLAGNIHFFARSTKQRSANLWKRFSIMILCCGEALIDMLPYELNTGQHCFVPKTGGSVFNTAVALGRLAVNVSLFTGISKDLFWRDAYKRTF